MVDVVSVETEVNVLTAVAIAFTFCCIRKGILAERPMGIPCKVYSAINRA